MTGTVDRVDTERYRATVARLQRVQKPNKGAPAYSRFVNRRAGRYLAAAAYRIGLTPNAVTAISAAFTFAAIAVLASVRPSAWMAIVVSLGLVIGYALDAADGQLARLRGGGTPAGEWLDHMVDCAKISALHLAVLISAYRYFDLKSTAWLLIPIGFAVVSAVMFFGMTLNDQLRRVEQARSGRPTQSAQSSTLRALLVVPTDYGLMCLAFLCLASTRVFFVVYVVLFAANAAFLALACIKWFRDMDAIGSGRVRPATAAESALRSDNGSLR